MELKLNELRLLTVLSLFVTFAMASAAIADELSLATSEDAQIFDQQLATSLKKEKTKDSFGQQVKVEAKKLKDEGSEKGKDFGKWVNGQRRQNESQAGSGADRAAVGAADKQKRGSRGKDR